MSDWPGTLFTPEKQVLSTGGPSSAIGRFGIVIGGSASAGVWPTANKAIYVPVELEFMAVAYQMSFVVSVQSGNYDIGIYDETGARIISKGSTAVPVAGLALWDMADTPLDPGIYYLALNIDNITASVNRNNFGSANIYRACGVREQAVGAVTLPNPATFANPSAAYLPQLQIHFLATV